MFANRRIRGALIGTVLVLLAALAVIALRAAYPRTESASLETAATMTPPPAQAEPQVEATEVRAPVTESRTIVPALVTRSSARQTRTAIQAPDATTDETPCPAGSTSTVSMGSVAAQEAPCAATNAPLPRLAGAGGHAVPRRSAVETRHEAEVRRSPVRMMTLGESTW
jgi:hypothetical protein